MFCPLSNVLEQIAEEVIFVQILSGKWLSIICKGKKRIYAVEKAEVAFAQLYSLSNLNGETICQKVNIRHA